LFGQIDAGVTSMSQDQLNHVAEPPPVAADAWHRALFLENYQPAWIFDPETLAFLAVNDAAVQRYGYSRERFLAMTMKDIRPPEDVPALLDSVANLEFGRRISGEWRHITADGSMMYVETATYDFEFEGRRARLAVMNDVTERHHAEEALKQTIDDYRGLFENAHDAILILSADNDEIVLDANQRACEMYGYTRGEFIGMSLRAISLNPERGDDHRRLTLQRGVVHHFETVQYRKDESEMFLEINGAAVTYKGQQAILSINRDVTERKRAEESLRSEHQKRRLHVEQTPLGVIEWDTHFCVTAWNPGAERIFGFSPEEAIGRCARDFLIPPDARQHVEGVWQELLASRGGHRSTNENITKDGRIIRCEWYNTPLIDARDHVVGVASLVQDVTEQVETRLALERSEALYRTLAEAMPAIVYRSVGNGMLEYVNGQWQRYTGLAPEQSMRRGWEAAIHPDDLPAVLEESRLSDQNQSGSQFHFRLRRYDGQYRWHLARAEPVKDPQTGKVLYWLGTTTDVDDLRRAQDAFAASESRFRMVAESVADVVSLHDLDGRFLYVSPAVRKVTGFEPHELVGRDGYEQIHPDDRQRVREQSHDLNLQGQSTLIQWRQLRKDGSYVWVETSTSVVNDEQGKPSQILCCTRDITARKADEEKLHRQSEILRTIFDHIPVMVSFVDSDLRYILLNRAWEETFGYSAQEAYSRDLLPELYPDPAEVARVREFIRRADGKTWGDFPTRRRDGSIVETTWINLRLDDGQIIGLGQDVTQRKRDEQALRTSEERFRQIAENIEEIFWVMDSSRKVLYINPAYERIWQQSVQSLYDDPGSWVNRVHPEDRAKALSEDPLCWEREFRLLRPDGSVRWVHSRAIPVRDADGNARIGVGICTDITSRKHMEEELRRHAEELNELVRQRTERIRELERQRVESEKLVATGRMAARIAHEINNPLAGITSAFALIKDAITPDHRYFSYVGRVDKEIDRISRITRQMFEVYRPETESPVTFELNQTVGEVTAMVEPEATAAGVRIRLSPAQTGLTTVTLPENAVRQVIYNILRNAVQASPAQETVDVKLDAPQSTQGDSAGEVMVCITDRGPGIDPEQRDKIFEPFFTTKSDRPNAGLGLGLSVANTAVLAMGGRIEFDSTLGKGTSFRIVLPTTSSRHR
jgi:PAS domain S-box-containing protein